MFWIYVLSLTSSAIGAMITYYVVVVPERKAHCIELKRVRGRLQEHLEVRTSEVLKKNEELREVRDELRKQLNIVIAERDQNAKRLREITEVVNCGTSHLTDYFKDE